MSRGDEMWDSMARWYLEICPRVKLDLDQLIALVNALRAALRAQEAMFLFGLAAAAVEYGEELPELITNQEIDLRVRADLEMEMTRSYRDVGIGLEEYATAPVFM
jgi:hypothetical protein